ncbi:MAG: hypothetical protein RLZZ320_74 [Actinomycetota bacterium]|jgi:glyoxylase-like metal-dependent hydrolase (beta-lactamase superfamily II)
MGLLVDRVVAPYYQTNCWIVAPSAGKECVVIDPGIDIPSLTPQIQEKLKQHNLKLGAIFITHGHLDHTFSLISAIEDFIEADCYIHESDRDLLAHPERAMGAPSQDLVKQLKAQINPNLNFTEPNRTWSLQHEQEIRFGEMRFRFLHTPGHTPGSTVAQVNDEVLISGDVLFRGSIGRTDLPRGSISDMERSLREKIATLSGELRVLPGHGDETSLISELKNNPYLQAAIEGRLA